MKLLEITESEFDSLPQSKKILCNDIEYSHKFAYLTVNDDIEPLVLCWQSEIVKPQITEKDNLVWFGIDQQIIAVNKLDGSIVLLLKLFSNLLEIIISESFIILRAELEIYRFNLAGIIEAVYYLPEISESIKVGANVIEITLIDEQVIKFKV